MNVRLVHEFRFEAAHRLPKLPETHKCFRLHGHSFKIELTIEGPVNPETGWLVDFGELHTLFKPLHDQLDHHYLNEIPGLERRSSQSVGRQPKRTFKHQREARLFERRVAHSPPTSAMHNFGSDGLRFEERDDGR